MAKQKSTDSKLPPKGSPATKKGRKRKTLEESVAEIASKKVLIKSIIESGTWSKLRDVATLIPKMMAEEMGFNHTRLVTKLRNPINLSVKDAVRMSFYFTVDPLLILGQVLKEINSNKELVSKLDKFKDLKELRAKK